MRFTTHFRSAHDVEQYFALLRELEPRTEPPADLWELMDRAKRSVQRRTSVPRRLLPSPQTIELQVFTSMRREKIVPAKALQKITAFPPVRRTNLPTRRIRSTPMSLTELLQSKRERGIADR
jgi:hypothetical protein